MTNSTTTALVSGANKGIGFETTRQLLAAGWTVWLGARDAVRGQEAADKLTAEGHPGTVRQLTLDVTDDSSVAAAVETVTETGLDVLVNNAGIAGGLTPPAETTAADFLPVYGVNVLGPVRMTHAFLPLLEKSEHPRIVNVSSGLGSFAITNEPGRIESTIYGLVYPSSKSALNMITTMYAKALPHLRINVVDPGYTATDLNGNSGTQPVEVGAAPVIAAAMIAKDGPTGGYFGNDGPLPW
ncbi:MAG: short-chain dehydrogenase/reductase [Nocardioidaceae bacterium]|nr:short-chain dehydrogenase/reductase [Nocardioidaceae bacterium]